MRTRALKATASVLLISCTLLAAAKQSGDAKQGMRLFDDSCAGCHYTDRPATKVGPSMKGLFKRAKMKNGTTPINDLTVRTLMELGGTGMPVFSDLLTEEEKDNIIAYLKTL